MGVTDGDERVSGRRVLHASQVEGTSRPLLANAAEAVRLQVEGRRDGRLPVDRYYYVVYEEVFETDKELPPTTTVAYAAKQAA